MKNSLLEQEKATTTPMFPVGMKTTNAEQRPNSYKYRLSMQRFAVGYFPKRKEAEIRASTSTLREAAARLCLKCSAKVWGSQRTISQSMRLTKSILGKTF